MKNSIKTKFVYLFFIAIIVIAILFVPSFKNNITNKSVNNTIYNDTKNADYTYTVTPDGTVYNWVENQGSGTIDDPYKIITNSDFLRFLDMIKISTSSANNLKGIYFTLENDLDFSGYEPITLAKHTNYFYGNFDGKGHVVKNLNGEFNGTVAASLFSRIDGVVKNFGLVGGKFIINTTADMSGVIASKVEKYGTVYNVFSTTELEFTTTNANKYPAGLVANNDGGKIINCYYDGKITSDESAIKYGLTRYEGTIISIINSFTGTNSTYDYSFAITNGKTLHANSIIRDSNQNEFLDITSTEALNKLNIYQVANNEKYFYKLSDDRTYLTFTEDKVDTSDFFDGDGSEDNPYLINEVADFNNFRKLISSGNTFEGKYFFQTDNLDYTNEPNMNQLTQEYIFSGTYDGGGHYLKNVELVGTNGSVFGGIINGTLKNFGLLGGNHYPINARFHGTIIRKIERANIYNVFSTMDVHITAKTLVSAAGLFGAVGELNNIENVYYGGHVYYDDDVDKTSVPFLSLFTRVDYNSKTGIVNINNAFWEDGYYGYHRDSNQKYDFSIPQDFLGGTNVTSLSLDELKGETLLNYLNDYVDERDDLNGWIISSVSEYPIQDGISPNRDKIILIKGDTYIINSNDETLSFRASNDKLSVDESGLVTAKEIGKSKINIYPEDSNIYTKQISFEIISDNIESSILSVELKDNNDKIVIGSEPNLLVSDFLDKLDNPIEFLKVYDLDNNLVDDITNEIIKTGYKVRLENNKNIFDEALIIIRGDINKDGDVNISDSVILGDHVLRKNEIEDYRLYAMELYFDDLINVSDNVKLGDYILRKIESLNN